MIVSPIKFQKSIHPKDSTFKIVYVDVVHRCNMECANCYLPNRTYPDIPLEDLKNFIDQFSVRTEFRLIGGEPTLHQDLHLLIKHINSGRVNHRVVLVTNGLKLASKKYTKKLVDAGLRSVYVSMNGFDQDSIYEKLDNLKCAKLKMKALTHCLEYKLNISIGFIIVKDVNEHLIPRMYEYFKDTKCIIMFEFRNIGNIGRNMIRDAAADNYTNSQIRDLICREFGIDSSNIIREDPYSVLYRKKPFVVRTNNWKDLPNRFDAATNSLRGRMTEDFNVAPFLEHIADNEGLY